uniref:Putative secreted salivary protein n=1 Tax=Ixodes scapularis TaxID=6945 RepID=Q4PN56_IXOSC|nr:putative secreted salivary protein [Ixodes scapularis]
MLLVLLAVVLILPAFQGDGVLFGLSTEFHCYSFLDPIGTLLCGLGGSKHYVGKHPKTCEVSCYDPYKKLKLPRPFCPGGSLKCGKDVEEKLKTFQEELEKKKNNTCEWCRGSQGK